MSPGTFPSSRTVPRSLDTRTEGPADPLLPAGAPVASTGTMLKDPESIPLLRESMSRPIWWVELKKTCPFTFVRNPSSMLTNYPPLSRVWVPHYHHLFHAV